MICSIAFRPPNSLVLIAASMETAEPKMFEPGKRIAATPTCIVVGCFTDVDGETNITLGPSAKASSPPAFEGLLETPNREVAVWTIEWQKLIAAKVPGGRTKIRIWTNHPTEPDEVYIGIGE